MTTDKTLATAKHGGCVQLATVPERERFEAWAKSRDPDFCIYRDGSYPFEWQGQWEAWQAAQPSPGGQGAEPVAHEYTFAGLGKRDSVAFIGPEYKPAAPKGMQLVGVRPLYAVRQPVGDMKRLVEVLVEIRSRLGPEDHELRDRIGDLIDNNSEVQ